MSRITRRTVLKSAAALGAPLAFPYLNLAHAQGSPIPIGVGLPLTGNAGAYGPDMAEAAKRTAAKINAAGACSAASSSSSSRTRSRAPRSPPT